MWFYNRDFEEIETLTCLETGVQVVRDEKRLWWCRPTHDEENDQDCVLIAESEVLVKFQKIIDALECKGNLAGFSRSET